MSGFVEVLQERVAHALSDCFKEHEEAWLRMQDASVRQMHEELLDLRRQLKQHQRNQQQTPEGDQCDHPLAELGVSDSEVPVVAEPEPPTFQVVQYKPVVANAVVQEAQQLKPQASNQSIAKAIVIRPEYLEALQHQVRGRATHVNGSHTVDEMQSMGQPGGPTAKMKSTRRILWKVPLRPDSRTHLAFELLSVVLLFHDSIMVPLNLSWDFSSKRPIYVLMMVSLGVWTLDICINFMTGYVRVEDGTIEMNRYKVCIHYLKTWFIVDFTVVAAEWTAVILEFVQTSGNTAAERSLVRLTKIGKFSRFLHIIFVIRLFRVAPKYHRSLGLSATWSLVPQIMQILATILYINHVNGCMWYLIGRAGYEGDDTGGRSWLNQMVTDEGPSYYHASFFFQYFTSVHWSITQMTPGSMEVTPKNSYERLWNIICLLFGLIFGSTFVGQLSSKMVQFNMARSKELKRMENLRKFLYENGVDAVFSRRVQQQAQQRLLGKVRLMEEDVEDLKNLPSELRGQLHTMIYSQYFLRHPLFCMWNAIDAALCRAVCASGALRLKGLLLGNDLFTPETAATESWLLLKGEMRYHRALRDEEYEGREEEEPMKELAVTGNRWLAEVVLWFKWSFVGTLQASGACEFVALECHLLIKVIQTHTRVGEPAFAWCTAFKEALSHMDGEVEVGIQPSQIILSLPKDTRSEISECALAAISERQTSRFMNLNGMVPTASADPLGKEVREGVCIIAVHASGEFLRTVHVVALKLRPSLDDEKFLVQLARMRVGQREDVEGTWETSLQLPGKKVRIGDDQVEAVTQVVADNLPELRSVIALGRSTLTAEIKESRSHGVQTEYLRTVFDAHMLPDSVLPSMGSVLTLEADSFFGELEVHVRQGANKTHLCAWVTEDQFSHLQSHATDITRNWFGANTGAHGILKTLVNKAQADMTIRAQSTSKSSAASSVASVSDSEEMEVFHCLSI